MPVIVCERCDHWLRDGTSNIGTNNIGECTYICDLPTTAPYIEHELTGGKVRFITPRLFGCNHHSSLEQLDDDLREDLRKEFADD